MMLYPWWNAVYSSLCALFSSSRSRERERERRFGGSGCCKEVWKLLYVWCELRQGELLKLCSVASLSAVNTLFIS